MGHFEYQTSWHVGEACPDTEGSGCKLDSRDYDRLLAAAKLSAALSAAGDAESQPTPPHGVTFVVLLGNAPGSYVVLFRSSLPRALAAAARWTGVMCAESPNTAVSTAASSVKPRAGNRLSQVSGRARSRKMK
jgi:hypothetical protein